GRVNNSIDYYDKGMLIAFGLDARLRNAKGNAAYGSLDEAFRAFYLKFFGTSDSLPPDYVGYTTKDVIAFFAEGQAELGPILEAQVLQPGHLDTTTQFEAIGFVVEWTETNYLGIFFMNDGAPTIYGIGDDSPAGAVG